MIRVAICDDDVVFLKRIEEDLKQKFYENRIRTEIICYSDGFNLLSDIEDGFFFDIIFSDIEMPGESAMEIIPKVIGLLPEIIVILITDHIKYAIDAFELDVFRYIPKNEYVIRIKGVITDLLLLFERKNSESYQINLDNRIERIPYNKILYISKIGKNSVFHLLNNKIVSERISLSKLFKRLPEKEYVFIDRGIIVNLLHVVGLNKYNITLSSNERLEISASRFCDIRREIYEFWNR